MMNFGRMPVGRTASRLARAVADKSESSMANMAARAAPKVAPVTMPLRHFGASPADIAAVEAATIKWRDTVTSNTPDAPKKTAALYADDCLFWGTVSEELRSEPQHFYDYFDMFARLPKLSMVAYDPEPPVVHCDGQFALHAGAYTFAWEVDGEMKETRARFTFGYRKEGDEYVMVKHHSSGMPQAPPGLKPAL